MRYLWLLFPLLLGAFDALPEHLPFYKLSTEKTLQKNYKSHIEPHYTRGIDGSFVGENKIKIVYKLFPVSKEKGSIVISSGRTESMVKYKELIYDLNHNGYSVYILDHRGQGFSGRMVADNQMGYVDVFDNYAHDLHHFIVKKVKTRKPKHLFLLGHSMGGAIAARTLELYDDGFEAAVLSSPMLQPNLYTPNTSHLICNLMELKNKKEVYAPGQVSYDKGEHLFKKNLLTHSKLRFDISEAESLEHSKTKLGGPSVGWIQQACLGSDKTVKEASKITIPLLILRGSADEIVNPDAEDVFCKNVSGTCSGYEIKGAWHELLVEKDSYRVEVVSALLTFFGGAYK